MIIERTDPELDELVDRIAECLQLGVQVDLAALIREHPQHEQQLRAVFHGVNEMARLVATSTANLSKTGSAIPNQGMDRTP